MKLCNNYVLIILLAVMTVDAQKSAITFTGGGRLGDKLIAYTKAKWLAYKYDLDFFCPGFSLSDSLMLHELEKPYVKKKTEKKFKKTITIKNESEIDPLDSDILYISPFYIKPVGLENCIDILETLNKHPEFLNHLRTMIAPLQSQRPIRIPQGMPSIALHIRRGGGFDQPLLHGTERKEGIEYADVRWPKRFPPDEYYIQQLKDMMKLFPEDQCVYVHLFTDDAHPEQMVEKYTKAMGRKNIQFGYRIDNDYASTVLEDLFGMTQFDYIVRSTSLFSFMATLLGHHTCMVWPKFTQWDDNYLTVVRVWVVNRLPGDVIKKLSVTVEYDEHNAHE